MPERADPSAVPATAAGGALLPIAPHREPREHTWCGWRHGRRRPFKDGRSTQRRHSHVNPLYVTKAFVYSPDMTQDRGRGDGTARKVEPTPRETEILQVLWGQGPSTVREVHEHLAAHPATESILRTTVLKHMQIMLEKGLLIRDDTVSPQLYRAALDRPHVERQMVDGFTRRLFGGSASRLILRALDSEDLSGEELDEIQKILDQHGRREKP